MTSSRRLRVAYTYGAASQRGQGTPLVGNVVGRITHIGAGTEDRLYGPLGEITQETRAIPIQGGQVPTYTTKFQFDTWNRIKQMIYPDNPDGELVQYFYDYGGLVRRVHGNDDQLETSYAAEIDYDRFGQRLLMSYGNGAVNTYAYQTDNRRLSEVTASLSATGYKFHDFLFSYDNVGNLKTLQNTTCADALDIHHRIPLEWAQLFPKTDPNRIANLIGLPNRENFLMTASRKSVHQEVNDIWTKFRTANPNPTAAEVMEQAAKIDQLYSQYYHYPR